MSTDSPAPDPQGRFLGIPYDVRTPTIARFRARFRARFWNPDDDRLLTPPAFGWGYAVNFHEIATSVRWVGY
jgi:hypothetical protein